MEVQLDLHSNLFDTLLTWILNIGQGMNSPISSKDAYGIYAVHSPDANEHFTILNSSLKVYSTPT